MTVEEIDYSMANDFIKTWHYSHVTPRGKNIFYGWYLDKELYAVADFGIGVNTNQATYLARVTAKPVTNSNLLELKRLCRVEPKKKAYLTQFISKCHKLLKKKGYKYIVSFSDPEHGHDGGIYRAANFKHIGKTDPEYHFVDREGNRRHRLYPHRYAQRNNSR